MCITVEKYCDITEKKKIYNWKGGTVPIKSVNFLSLLLLLATIKLMKGSLLILMDVFTQLRRVKVKAECTVHETRN